MTATDLLSAIGFALIVIGLLLYGLPIGCDACPHCLAERVNPRCPMCFRKHSPNERCP